MYREQAPRRRVRFTTRMLGMVMLALFAGALPGLAQTASDDDAIYDGGFDFKDPVGWGTRLGLGFTANPTTFLVDVAVPYHIGDGVSLGPRVQLGFGNDDSIVAPTLSLEYAHDLTRQVDAPWNRLRPLIQAGIGFAWIEEEGRPGSDDEAGFLVDIGVGVEYPLSERFSVASVIDFNILPTEILDEYLFFTWQVAQLRVNF